LSFLEKTTEHPTAVTIYEYIRQNIPGISLGTVYRNLSFLVDAGKIIRIRVRDDTQRYDAFLHEHYHWQCRVCGKVGDLSMDIDPRLNDEAERQSGFKIERHELYFIGICNECSETVYASEKSP